MPSRSVYINADVDSNHIVFSKVPSSCRSLVVVQSFRIWQHCIRWLWTNCPLPSLFGTPDCALVIISIVNDKTLMGLNFGEISKTNVTRNFGKVIQNYEYIEILDWFLANKFSENSTIRQNVSSAKLSSFTVHLIMSMFKMCCVFFIRVFCMYWHCLKNVLIEYFCLDSFKTLTWFS